MGYMVKVLVAHGEVQHCLSVDRGFPWQTDRSETLHIHKEMIPWLAEYPQE